MRDQIDRIACSLKHGDAGAEGPHHAGVTPLLAQDAEDFAHEDARDAGEELGIVGDHRADRKRQRQNPLSNRNVGEDAIEDMG